MLDVGARERIFDYHPRCKILGLTHLCFADDLLVFVKGTRTSIDGVVGILKHFTMLSGLVANLQKSSIFTAGLNSDQFQAIRSLFPFVEASLAVRYLGFPLLTKRFSSEDYVVFVEKVRSKLASWTSLFLSYAGRLLLLKSVIYDMVMFWQSAFYLPAACLKEIEGLCSAFLWDGPALNSSKVQIAWSTVCLDKKEGGLGMRSLKMINKVSCLKLIWRIVSNQSTLWVRWVNAYLLRGNSFWSYTPSTLGTWMYKKLFKFRELAANLHRVEVRSGRGTSFWYDNWSELGRLIDLVGPRRYIELGIPSGATVADAVLMRRRRRHRDDLYEQIEIAIRGVETGVKGNSLLEDTHLWRYSADRFASSFNSSRTWSLICAPHQLVTWSSFVWIKQATPKHAFLLWRICRDSLQTLDKMSRWNSSIMNVCSLCLVTRESRNHLFFECFFSTDVWRKLMGNCLGAQFTIRLWELARFLLSEKDKDRVRRFVQLYCLQATVYAIWTERNARRHGSIPCNQDSLVRLVDKQVRNKLFALQEEGFTQYCNSLQYWFSFKIHS